MRVTFAETEYRAVELDPVLQATQYRIGKVIHRGRSREAIEIDELSNQRFQVRLAQDFTATSVRPTTRTRAPLCHGAGLITTRVLPSSMRTVIR